MGVCLVCKWPDDRTKQADMLFLMFFSLWVANQVAYLIYEQFLPKNTTQIILLIIKSLNFATNYTKS